MAIPHHIVQPTYIEQISHLLQVLNTFNCGHQVSSLDDVGYLLNILKDKKVAFSYRFDRNVSLESIANQVIADLSIRFALMSKLLPSDPFIRGIDLGNASILVLQGDSIKYEDPLEVGTFDFISGVVHLDMLANAVFNNDKIAASSVMILPLKFNGAQLVFSQTLESNRFLRQLALCPSPAPHPYPVILLVQHVYEFIIKDQMHFCFYYDEGTPKFVLSDRMNKIKYDFDTSGLYCDPEYVDKTLSAISNIISK